ncbi:MAG: hypothetical protein PHS59_16650 [Paludibacter sp.]|nr:hypothetical protein [Paludibacter sp.]
MVHNFEHSLEHERNQAIKADTFYREKLNATDIKRFNTDSEADMEMQRQDVDVLISLNNVTYRVSEKFRDKDYGDLYVEVFSKYPKIQGWLKTGSPNAILYFTPNSVYWITHKSLATFCLNTLFPLIPQKWYSELYQSHKTIITKYLKLQNKLFKINIIQAHNSLSDGTKWETIGISAAFSLFEENGVKIKKMNL